jgi:SecD/SecF fusion protein
VFIAGLLSIIGYSINDTIVTFDRLREKINDYEGELSSKKIKELSNSAIKETLKRSFLTSLTTILAVIILMSFGNATKLSFNIAMFIGLVVGTYSSIFIATFS